MTPLILIAYTLFILIGGIAIGMTLGRDYLDGLLRKPVVSEPKFAGVLLPNQGRVIDVDWRELDKPTVNRNREAAHG